MPNNDGISAINEMMAIHSQPKGVPHSTYTREYGL